MLPSSRLATARRAGFAVAEVLPDAMFRRSLQIEDEFVLLGSRTVLSGARAQRFDKLLEESALRWPIVLQVCQRHRVAGLVGRHLSARGWRGVPPDIAREWSLYFGHMALQSRELSQELGRVCAALEGAGVPVVSFKGPTLAHALYGNGVLRPSADLDLLVARSDVKRAQEALRTLGYEHEARLSPTQERQHLRVDSVFNLARPAPEAIAELFPQGFAVELHWAITSPCLPFDLTFPELAPRLGWMRLPGHEAPVRALAPLDLLLILLVHGAKHLWERLLWLSDIAQLFTHASTLKDGPLLDGSDILTTARVRGVERMTALGLSLSRDVMGTTLPREVQTWLSTQPQALRLASRLRADLFARDDAPTAKSTWETTHLLSQAIDDPLKRLGLFWHIVATPSALDRERVALPPALEPLWRVLGPLQRRAGR